MRHLNGLTLAAGLLLLGLTAGQTLGQSSPATPAAGDELQFRGDRDTSTPAADTNVIEDSTSPRTPTSDESSGASDRPLVQPLRPTDQPGPFDFNRPRPRPHHHPHHPHPQPFNPFHFLLGPPPSFGPMGQQQQLQQHQLNDDDDDEDDFFGLSLPFRNSPLMGLLNGGLLRPGRLPSPADFRAQMDQSIRELEGKPAVWAKEVQRYSNNGVQYEVIKFTRKVENQSNQNNGNNRQQVPAIDGPSNSNGEQQQQIGELEKSSPSTPTIVSDAQTNARNGNNLI